MNRRCVPVLVVLVTVLSQRIGLAADTPQHTIMRPDHATMLEWFQAHDAMPKAPMAPLRDELLAPAASLSLLPHLNYVPAERNQGYCGNCWCWAGHGCLEILLDVQNGIFDRLSVQEMNSCESAAIGKTCCSGGWLSDVASFYSTTGYKRAIPWSNSGASWQDGDASCDTSCGSITTTLNYPVHSISAISITTHGVGQAQAIANIKAVLNQNKPVAFAFFMAKQTDWNTFFSAWDYQAESATVDFDYACGHTWDSGGGGHEVLCVGYNEDNPANRYWIMVNSWGTTAGRPNGVFHVKMDENYDCTFYEAGWYYSYYWEYLNVAYSTASPPQLMVAPLGLTNSCVQGVNATNQSFTVWNATTGTVTYGLSDNAAWLTCSPTNGTSTGEHDAITVSYGSAGLTAGVYAATITVTGAPPATGSPQTIAVRLTVTPAPALSVSPTNLAPGCTVGQTASNQSFTVWNATTGTLTYGMGENAAWLTCSPTSGTSTGEHDTITVSYSSAGLTAGVYGATITVTGAPPATGSPQTIAVRLTVTPAPALSLSSTNLAPSCTVGQNASNQSFTVWNATTGTLTYGMGENAAWLTCSPTSGTSTGEHDTITVSYSSAGLTAGVYGATITVTGAPPATGSPQTIAVRLTVNAAGGVPGLALSPTSLVARCTVGEIPATQTTEVWNAGSGTLNYRFSDNATWLSESPSSGTSTGAHDKVKVNYSTAGIWTGTYAAVITVADTNAGVTGSPRTIPVTLTVTGSPNVVIVDNADATGVKAAGVWTLTTSSSAFKGAYHSDGNTNKGSKSVTFTPTLPLSTNYDVYLWYVSSSSRATNVPVDVTYSGGSTTAVVNQRVNGSKWNLLGRYRFAAGTSGWVKIRTDGTTTGAVAADAVKFVKVVPPALTVSLTNLTASCTQGQNAASQSIEVWNSGPGILAYGIGDDASWLTCSPTNGTSTGEHDTITVKYSTSALATGTYTAAITVASTNGTSSPKTVAVRLTVNPAPPAVLAASPAPLTPSCVVGDNAATQYCQVWNAGGGTLSYKVTDNASWLSESPTSGTSTGEHDQVAVKYSTAGLWLGAYAATVTVTSTNGHGWTNTIPVTLTVTSSPSVVIVDNADVAGVKTVGVWKSSSSSSAVKGAYFYDNNTNKGLSSVTFTPNLPTNGNYEVSIWYVSSSTYASNTPVDVAYSGGTNTVWANQQANGSKWVVLGTNTFKAGTSGWVRVRNAGTGEKVIADAVKFRKLGVSPAPDVPVHLASLEVGELAASVLNSKADAAPQASDSPELVSGRLPEPDARHPVRLWIWTSGDWSKEFGASNMIDGDTNTFWIGDHGGAPWRVIADLGAVEEVGDLQVLFRDAAWTNLGIIGSADAAAWFDCRALTNGRVALRYLYLNLWGNTNPPAIREIIWRGRASGTDGQ